MRISIIAVFIILLMNNQTLVVQDYEEAMSPDGRQIVFIRAVKECPRTPDAGWFPSDFDEIWSMDRDGSNKKCLIKNNYSEKRDADSYLGSFGSLRWSPDSKYIYFLCQNGTTTALLYRKI